MQVPEKATLGHHSTSTSLATVVWKTTEIPQIHVQTLAPSKGYLKRTIIAEYLTKKALLSWLTQNHVNSFLLPAQHCV